jgi:hypothetical protein
MAVVATRGLEAWPVDPALFARRVIAIDVVAEDRIIRVVGVDTPTSGITADSSLR